MSEIINIQTDVVDNTSSKMNSDSLLKFIENSSTEAIKSKIESDKGISKLIKTYFKNTNEKILGEYSKYGINLRTVQQSLVNYKYNIGDSGSKKDGVDGSFGEDTFLAIINMQKILGQKPTGIIDLELLKYLFPYDLRAINQKEGRNPAEMYGFVNGRISRYNRDLKREKNSVVDETRIQIGELKKETEIGKEEPIKGEKDSKESKGEIKGIPTKISSLKPEKKRGVTQCSKTARNNLYRLGVNPEEVPVGISAIKSLKKYGDKENYVNNIPEVLGKANVLDLFVNSKSKYEHRAVAYMNSGNWYVLDPYIRLGSNHNDLKLPIPLDEYLASQKLLGVFPYVV